MDEQNLDLKDRNDKVLNQSIDEKETALREREVLDKQNLDLEDRPLMKRKQH